jgi:2,4-dienoyl-CoA reductase-like NADH-dependent reductase (Old Yellow Enzyme family)|nr:hypothetical protein [Gloeotrichia echinulata DEX184]
MNETINLFTPFELGALTLGNRIIMAPMTRSRAGGGQKRVPTTLNATYYTKETATAVLAEDNADLVSFGSLFIANPDLPERFRLDAPLNQADPATFYANPCDDSVDNCGFEKGYTDYPFQ